MPSPSPSSSPQTNEWSKRAIGMSQSSTATAQRDSPLVAVIVINWETCERTIACLRALQRQDYPQLWILAVDNGSGDGSAEQICAAFPMIEVIALEHNLGFARGVNRGIRCALALGCEYVLLLNSDADAPPDTVTRLVAAMQRSPQTGVATPKILYTGEQRFLWGIGGRMYPAWLIVYGMGEIDRGQYDRIALDFVFGCAMIIRRAVFDTIGLFDERFFMYYEDGDFCLRAKKAGYQIGLFPEIKIWHDGSASTRSRDHLREFYHIRSRILFFRKHVQGLRIIQFGLRETLYVFGIVRRNLFAGKFANIAWYFKGLAQGMAWPIDQISASEDASTDISTKLQPGIRP
jgi:GT2 family glycosyltransferase